MDQCCCHCHANHPQGVSRAARPPLHHPWLTMLSSRSRHNPTEGRHDPHIDAIRITYWTCLQLESDILAELDMPQSGIGRFEDQVPFPLGPRHHDSLYTSSNVEMSEVMWYYSQQVWLRRLLNKTHSSLYKPATQAKPADSEELFEDLKAWKMSLSNTSEYKLAWDDDDPPATHINAARMRGKYYGACCIINRPALQRAMAMLEKVDVTTSPMSQNHKHAMLQGFASVRDWQEVSDKEAFEIATILGIDQKTMDGCRQCVGAAIRSTEAFDGLYTMPRRLHVTNVFGTAQAYVTDPSDSQTLNTLSTALWYQQADNTCADNSATCLFSPPSRVASIYSGSSLAKPSSDFLIAPLPS